MRPGLRQILLGGGFSPRRIPGLGLWLDASRIGGLADGAALSAWADASGQANDASQGTGAQQPLYKIVSGVPEVLSDGSDDNLSIAHAPGIATSGGMTFLAVINPSSVAAGFACLALKRFNATNFCNYYLGRTANKLYFESTNTGSTAFSNTSTTVTLAASAWQIVEFVYDDAADLTTFSVNATTQSLAQAGVMVAPTSGSLTLFRNGIGSSEPIGIHLRQAVIYNRALSVSERQALKDYWNKLYSIY